MGVDPHRPRLDPPRQAMRVGEGSGPDARGEAVGAVVRLPDHGIEVAIAMDDEHRAEDLFPRNAVASCDIRDDRRREEGARLAQAIAAADDAGPVAARLVDEPRHPPGLDRKSTRLNYSPTCASRMPYSV